MNQLISDIVEVAYKVYYKKTMKKAILQFIKDSHYRVFSTSKELDKWAIYLNNNFETDRSDLYQFPQKALDMYCGNMSKHINYYLRTGELIRYIPEIELTLDALITSIDIAIKNNILQEDILGVRWVKTKYMETYIGVTNKDIKKGHIYTDRGYISTSLWSSYIGQYKNEKRILHEHVVFLIKIPKGTHGVYVEHDIRPREEYEFILGKESQFLVEEIYFFLNRPFIITCKLVIK